jgi:hypothetical protein
MKNKIFTIILTIILFMLCESLSYWGLSYLEGEGKIKFFQTKDLTLQYHQKDLLTKILNDETAYLDYSSTLGWKTKANAQSGLYRTNSQGMRNDRDFTPAVPQGRLRIATFGDSFMHGDDVANDETWQEMMMAENDKLEVMNFGVPGYGVDQCYLRYLKEGQAFNPDIVLLGIILDDFHRVVTINQYFISQITTLTLMKPRYFLKGEGIELFANPFSKREDYLMMLKDTNRFFHEYGQHDFFYNRILFEDKLSSSNLLKLSQIFIEKMRERLFDPEIFVNQYYPGVKKTVGGCVNSRSQSFLLTNRIIGEFHRKARENGSKFFVVYFPGIGDFNTYKYLRIKRHQALVDALEENNIPFLDMTEPLVTKNKDADGKILYSRTHHFSALGQRQVKAILDDFLTSHMDYASLKNE